MNDTLRNAFYEEADELFQEIENCILEIDRLGATTEKIDSLFRNMHTLKGSSAAMEINDMARLTHHLEDILGMVRDQKLTVTGEMIDLMLKCLDELRIRVEKHRLDEPYIIPVESYTALLDQLKTGDSDQRTVSIINSLGPGEKEYMIQVYLHKDSPMKEARLFLITEKLKKEGQILKTSWDSIQIDDKNDREFHILYSSHLIADEIENLILTISDIDKAEVQELHRDKPEDQPRKGSEELQPVIRVNVKKLDQLLRIVEELSVDKERLKQQMKRAEEKYSSDDDIRSLSTLVQQIDFIVNEMQESVLSTRMYTLDSVFNRFPRMIRDLSQKQGKDIRLIMEGEGTELDRSIMESIIDPLNHIIRNAVDHGIESPEERKKQGKDPTGTIKLTAGQEQGHIYIKIKDDGRGINLAKVKERALSRQLVTENQLESLTEKEVLELIFMPGFSTADAVTQVSGRGIGMNVVKENIERVNGMIELENEEGKGLAITLKLPLTLAIIQSLLIRTHQYRFVLPLFSIIEIFRIKEKDYEKQIRFVRGKEVINWRGEVLPVIRVSDLFNAGEEKQNSFVGIIIGLSTRKIVLAVEEIIGQQQVVIKSLDRFMGEDNVLGELKGISGTVILGDGDFAYVLDVQTLLN